MLRRQLAPAALLVAVLVALPSCSFLLESDVPQGTPSPARWVLDPAAQPRPDDTSFVALVNEIPCSGGRDIDGKLLPPRVEYLEDRIVVALHLEPLPGGPDAAYECPLPPPTRFVIQLDEPIGDRALVDAHDDDGLL